MNTSRKRVAGILTPAKWYQKDQGHPMMTWNSVLGVSQGSLGNLDNSSPELDGKAQCMEQSI